MNSPKKLALIISTFFSLLLMFTTITPASAFVASSNSYRIQSDSVNIGGGIESSDNYNINNTEGESGTGLLTSSSYNLKVGYIQTQDYSIPIITLLGEASLSIVQWDTYTDEGATVADDTEGDITSNIVTINPVDTSIPGIYTVTYNVTDSVGNDADQVSRTVRVLPAGAASPGTMQQSAIIQSINNLKFSDFDIVIDLESFTISWETTEPTVSILSWGETSELLAGEKTETVFSHKHFFKINNLKLSSKYYFKVESKTSAGALFINSGKFNTAPLPDLTPPANVSQLQSLPQENQILLSWINPTDSDFKYVKILRSEDFFVTGPFDGVVVYEGRGVNAIDTNVKKDTLYYYSVFSVDGDSNFSSGSIISSKISSGDESSSLTIEDLIKLGELKITITPGALEKLTLEDFSFFQDGKIVPGTTSLLKRINRLDGRKSLTMSLDKEKAPNQFKSIVLVIIDSEDRNNTSSFFLAEDFEKTKYETTVAPLRQSGIFEFYILFINKDNEVVKRLQGDFLIEVMIKETIIQTIEKILSKVYKPSQIFFEQTGIIYEKSFTGVSEILSQKIKPAVEDILYKLVTFVKTFWTKVTDLF
jgi:hypothetical protein